MPAPRGRGAPPINTSNVPAHRATIVQHPLARLLDHSRNSSYQDNNSASAPPTPDTSGVHPSRLQRIDRSPTESSRPPPPPPPPISVISSSRPSRQCTCERAFRAVSDITSSSSRSAICRSLLVAAAARADTHWHQSTTRYRRQIQGPPGRGRGSMRQGSGTFNSHAAHHPRGMDPGQRVFAPQQQDLFGAPNPNGMPVGPRPTSSRQDSARERRAEGEEREARSEDRLEDMVHAREKDIAVSGSPGKRKDERDPSRRDERPSRRDENLPHGDDQKRL